MAVEHPELRELLASVREDVEQDRLARGRLLLWSLGAGVSPRARHWRAWDERSKLLYGHTVSGCSRLVVAASPALAVRSVMDEARAVLAPTVRAVEPGVLERYLRVPEVEQARWLALRGYGSLSHGAGGEAVEYRVFGAPVDLLAAAGYRVPPVRQVPDDTDRLSTQKHQLPNVTPREESAAERGATLGPWAPPA